MALAASLERAVRLVHQAAQEYQASAVYLASLERVVLQVHQAIQASRVSRALAA